MTVHDPSERVFTMNQNRCSRWSRIRTLDGADLGAYLKMYAYGCGILFSVPPPRRIFLINRYMCNIRVHLNCAVVRFLRMFLELMVLCLHLVRMVFIYLGPTSTCSATDCAEWLNPGISQDTAC